MVCKPVTPALRRLRQEDQELKVMLVYNREFKASLVYIIILPKKHRNKLRTLCVGRFQILSM